MSSPNSKLEMYHRRDSGWLTYWAERPLEGCLQLGSDSGQHRRMLKRGTLWCQPSFWWSQQTSWFMCLKSGVVGADNNIRVAYDFQEGRRVRKCELCWQRGKMVLKIDQGVLPVTSEIPLTKWNKSWELRRVLQNHISAGNAKWPWTSGRDCADWGPLGIISVLSTNLMLYTSVTQCCISLISFWYRVLVLYFRYSQGCWEKKLC